MIIHGDKPTCAHALWGNTTLLCDRATGHDGAHTYHASDGSGIPDAAREGEVGS